MHRADGLNSGLFSVRSPCATRLRRLIGQLFSHSVSSATIHISEISF